MSAGPTQTSDSPSGAQTSFFRQSGWMMLTGVGAGACFFGVHFFSKKIPEAEYGILGTLLAVLNCLSIPTLGLQMVFAQQTAAAITPEQQRQLSSTTRAVLIGSYLLWLHIALLALVFQGSIVTHFKFSNPAAVWVTLLMGLVSLWKPLFSGLVQGRQNFLWLGTTYLIEGVGRLSFVALIVLVLHGWATGIMSGALLALAIIISLLAWQSWLVLTGPGAPFAWQRWFARVIPLTLGLGACQVLFTTDPIFVQYYFDGAVTHPYMAAGTLSRALVFFTGPVAMVMFPKIVRSKARAEKTDVMGLALITTAALGVLGALALTFIAPWLLPFVFKETFKDAIPLLPPFAFAMVPLTVSNVLVYNLLARERYAVVPWLVLLAVAYATTITFFHGTFLTVIAVLGVFNVLLVAVAAWFTWVRR